MTLNSSSFGSIKNIPLNCLALSSFGFSIAHLCFAIFCAASEKCVHKSGHTLSGREVVCFLVSLHPYLSGGLSFNKMNLVKPVHESDNSLSIHVPIIFNIFLEHYVHCRFWCSGNFDVLRRKGNVSSRHVQFDSGFHAMTLNEVSCDRPEVIFRFLIITRWVFFEMGWRNPFIWISLEEFPVLRLVQFEVDVLRRCPLPKIWLFHLRRWRWSFHFFAALTTFFALSLWAWSLDASISSNSSMSATTTSPFQIQHPHTIHSREIFQARLLRRLDAVARRWSPTIAPNGISGPIKSIPNHISWGVLSKEILSLIFLQIAVTFHGIRPPFDFQAGLQ